MTKIIIFLLSIFLSLSCDTIYDEIIVYEETNTPIPENPVQPILVPSQLIGAWQRDNTIIEFYDNKDFSIYDALTELESNYGYYVDNGDNVYLNDPLRGQETTYIYEIVEVLELGEVYSVSLVWHVDGGGDVVWGKM